MSGRGFSANLSRHNVMLLRNHGTLTVGRSVAEAFLWMSIISLRREKRAQSNQCASITRHIGVSGGQGTDLSAYLQAKLDKVARQLNERLRKTLGFATPAERFNACVASIP